METVRVLLADSDQYLRDSYREELTQHGLEVATAADGLVCLAQLRQFRPHVLVLDPSLPWGGGDGILALMLDDAELPQIPVIVLATGCDRSSLYRLARFYVQGYHVKPLDTRELAERIHTVARQARSHGQPAETT